MQLGIGDPSLRFDDRTGVPTDDSICLPASATGRRSPAPTDTEALADLKIWCAKLSESCHGQVEGDVLVQPLLIEGFSAWS
jgi:hypothetical protein